MKSDKKLKLSIYQKRVEAITAHIRDAKEQSERLGHQFKRVKTGPNLRRLECKSCGAFLEAKYKPVPVMKIKRPGVVTFDNTKINGKHMTNVYGSLALKGICPSAFKNEEPEI